MDQSIRREVSDAGIATLTLDRPGSTANVFDSSTLDELNQHLDFLEMEKSAKGLIIRSAKQKVFVAGADLNSFTKEMSAERIEAVIDRGQKTFERIARLPYPTVAAIHGVALGGGFELALACDYRIASSDGATKLALPETTLGILPTWGGLTRLPRLIGLPNALEAIMTGRTYPAERALKLGMVDAVVFPEKLLAVAGAKIQRSAGTKRKSSTHLPNRPPLSRLIKSQA
ncbi:MAG TPA: enoyl-CoA hydratase-related protein, partial [Chthoniobacterales bacterium]